MTRIILTATGAGTWTVPSDWDSANNTIELISAAADGSVQVQAGAYMSGGQGGGGGQYAILANVALTPGAVINFHVGVGNGTTSSSSPASPQAGDSWFGASTTVFAQGAYGQIGGSYHPAGPSYPWAWNDGGSVPNVDAAQSANGGGGAGGPHGPGGLATNARGLWEGASSGAAANGGANGEENFNSGGGFVGLGGGNGGNNRLGAGGGLGSYGTLGGPLAYAQPGTGGAGGGGGYGRSGVNTPPGGAINQWHTDGANGSTDAVWGGIYGPGSGGGGGGGGDDIAGGPIGGVGGNGGQFGGGGGGSATASGPVGLGGQGLIVITYRGTGSADGRGRLRTRYVRKAA